MARIGINYDDVQTAAHAILARGENPTIQRIREYLGTGSNSTISTHLRSWQQQFQGDPSSALPASVPEQLMPALERFWQTALEQAQAEFAELREEAKHQAQEAQDQRDLALKERDQSRQQLHLAEQRISEQKQTRQALEQQLSEANQLRGQAETRNAQQQETIATLRTELSATQQAATEAEQRHQVERQRSQVETEQQLQTERERGQQTEARLLSLVDQLRAEQRQQRADWEQKLADAETRHNAAGSQWQQQLEQIRQTATEYQAECAILAEKLDLLKDQLQQSTQSCAELRNSELRLTRDNEALRQRLTTTGEERDRLSARLTEKTDQLDQLRDALSQAEQARQVAELALQLRSPD